MSKERFEERKADFLSANARLQDVVTEPRTDIVRDAAIQRFEFTFEAMWKVVKLYLNGRGYKANSPRDVLKLAFGEGLIPTEDEADAWLQMLTDRNLTTHTYRESLAEEIYERILSAHARHLNFMAQRVEGLSWE